MPAPVVAVAESAIRSVDDAARMAAAGFDAVLVGEMLVKAPDPTAAVRGLAAVGARRHADSGRGRPAADSVGPDRDERSPVDLDLSDDQELFRETTTRFIEARCPLPKVRELADTPVAHDPAMLGDAGELGWFARLRPRGIRRRQRVGLAVRATR